MMMSPYQTSSAQGRFRDASAPSQAAGSLKSADGGGLRAPDLSHGYVATADVIEVPRRVLLVDPSVSERSWLRNELNAGQMEVFEACDVISALRAIPIFQPSVILAQSRLSTHGGEELLRRLKQDHTTEAIPVLLYADFASPIERTRAIDMGAVDFVCKPFAGAELLARVRTAMRTVLLLTMLEKRSRLDGLTGLANRGVLDDHLLWAWEACRRRRSPLAVILCHVDHFKSISDTYGKTSGDMVLRQTAASLVRTVRSSDLVARHGSEEFAVVAPDCDLRAALGLTERFRAELRGLEMAERGRKIQVTASVGVAVSLDPGQTNPSELLDWAGAALRQSKQSGPSSSWYWDSARKEPALVDVR
jgi:diguanylate cyclase (GGDEF)-like protein